MKDIPIEIYGDSKSLYDTLKPKKNVTEKRLRIDIAILRELWANYIILIPDASQQNALTKKGASSKEL